VHLVETAAKIAVNMLAGMRGSLRCTPITRSTSCTTLSHCTRYRIVPCTLPSASDRVGQTCQWLVFCSSGLQAGQYPDASKAAGRVEGHQKAVTMLLVAVSYEQDDLIGGGAGIRVSTQVPCSQWHTAHTSANATPMCNPTTAGCRRQLDRCTPEDPDTLVNMG
jgi:hypothetical protein